MNLCMSSLLQNFPWVSGTWDSWRPVLRRKQRRHCVPLPSQCPAPPGPLPIYHKARISPSLLFAPDLLVQVLVVLYVPHQIQLQMGFSLPIPINACLDSLSSRSTGPAYNHLQLPFYAMSLVMSSLFIHTDHWSPLHNFLHKEMTTPELKRCDT